MDQTRKIYSIPALVGVAVFLLSVPAAAIDGAQVSVGPTALSFALEGVDERVALTVGGPGDLRVKRTFEAGLTPTFELFDEAGNRYPDGGYTWELWAAPARAMRTREQPAHGIEARVRTEVLASGDFTIAEGGFVNPQPTEEVRAKAVEVPAKDFVVEQGDLIVDGSTCIGVDCYYNGESFNFDTLRLKENNLRIHFQDTSTSAFFPTNDWRITVNDTNDGGANKFSIDDVDSNRSPFTIEAGAREHSLYVERYGEIGLGTKDPERNLHIVSGNTPALRLEQNGSAGFTPQTWDVGANEANFYVSDASDGFKLSLRIEPKAPTNSLFIAADGDIGLGTATPAEKLHIENTAGDDSDDFVVNSAGYLGLGTVTPVDRIHIANTAGDDGDDFVVTSNGFIGIGTVTPVDRIHIANADVDDSDDFVVNSAGFIGSGTIAPLERIHVENTAIGDGDDFVVTSAGFIGSGVVAPVERLHLQGDAGENPGIRLVHYNIDNLGWSFKVVGVDEFRISKQSVPGAEFKLDASGNLTIKGHLIAQDGDGATDPGDQFPDHVFEPDYELMPLADLAAFVGREKHLPNVPSADEIRAQGGINMTRLQLRLLEKVEELTLYTLTQQQTIEELTRHRLAQQQTIEELREELRALKQGE